MNRNLKQYSDSELIELIRVDRKLRDQAFSELYDRYAVKIRSFCSYMIQNSEHTEDVFQESFINFYNNIIEGRDLTNPAGFLMSIARNLCMKYYRDKKITVPLENEQFFVDERNKYENNEMFSLIVKALQLLDEKYREAFILREIEGNSYEEIAKICDTTVTNAKSRVFRAHKQIIEILKPYLKDLAK